MQILWKDSAVLLDDALIFGDLHIGLEDELRKSGYRLIRMHRSILAKILDLIERTRARKIVMLGDIKHSIGNPTENELYQLEELFSGIPVETWVVLGNHDGGLAEYLDSWGIKHWPSRGFLYGEYYLFHGNARPDESSRRARLMLACHWHPMIRIRDSKGLIYSERIWVKAKTELGPDLLMLPAFNNLVGGVTLNEVSETWINLDEAEIYLSDGLFLGLWRDIRRDEIVQAGGGSQGRS